jgi:hypothetical protein
MSDWWEEMRDGDVLPDIPGSKFRPGNWLDTTTDFLSDNWANLVQVGLGAYSAYQASQAADTANQLYEVSSDLAKEQAQLAREQWERYKQIYGPLEEQQVAAQRALIESSLPVQLEYLAAQRALIDPTFNLQLKQMEAQREVLDASLPSLLQDIDLYNQSRDVERQFYEKSLEGVSPEKLAGQYTADVNKAFSGARDKLARDMSRYGIAPNSGRYASALSNLARSEALATAGARTKAYRDADELSWNRLGQATNVRKGLSPSVPVGTTPGIGLTPLQVNTLSGQSLANNAATGLSSAGSTFANLAGTAANAASKTYSSAAQTIGLGLSGFQDWLNKR